MLIVQATVAYAPNWKMGGPSRIMYDYACELIARGHRVVVITPEFNRPQEGSWSGFPVGLDIHYIKARGGVLGRIYWDYSEREIYSILDSLGGKIDYIHIAQSRTLLNVVMYRYARRHGVAVAVSAFGSMPRRAMWKWPYDKVFLQRLVRSADLLLAQTNHECEVYRKFGAREGNIHLLPLAVKDMPLSLNTELSRRRFRTDCGFPEECRLLVFVGRLHKTKGVPNLVRAFARIAISDDAYLAIVGYDDGDLGSIEATIAELQLERRVCLFGPLYDNERWVAYEAADIFAITPEIFEETSLASLEALSRGTPLITTNRADVPWLEEYGAGAVVSSECDAIASQMSAMLSESMAQKNARREAARSLIGARFSINAVGEVLERLLRLYRTQAKRQHGPLLIGPMLSRQKLITGQSVCFSILLDYLKESAWSFDCVDISGREGLDKIGGLRRVLEYSLMLVEMIRKISSKRRVVYLTIAQSKRGFLRDLIFTSIARLRGCAVIVHLHGGNYSGFYWSQNRFTRGLIRGMLRKTENIVVLSEKLKSNFDFDNMLRSKLRVVPNCSPCEPATMPDRSQTIGHNMPLKLLFLANLIDSKGWIKVLEVVAALRARGVNASATFCGEMELIKKQGDHVGSKLQAKDRFRNCAREHRVEEFVTYLGRVWGAQKDAVLRGHHIMLLPTQYEYEGQPVALIEALAYGIPVISSDFRAIGDIVIDGTTGYLVPPEEPIYSANVIENLWRNPLLYAEMSMKCKQHYRNCFSREHYTSELQRILLDNMTAVKK